jgi:low affinity Fe/Cu permease
METLFNKFAQRTARFAGHPSAFISAVCLIVVWAITGPLFRYSDAWQLVINTGTTIVTFLMVFLIQNSQNRDGLAIQLKLTELVLASHGARNTIADIEDLTDSELEKLHLASRKRAELACRTLEHRRKRKSLGQRRSRPHRAAAQRKSATAKRSAGRRTGGKL